MRLKFQRLKLQRLDLKVLTPLLALALFSPTAHAFVGLSLLGGVTKDDQASQVGAGGGLLLDLRRPMSRIGLETGVLVLGNRYSGFESATSIYVPATLNVHLLFLTLYGGGFYDSYTKSGWSPDYGWRAGARIGRRRWFLDASYSRGLKDYFGVHRSTVMGMLGFRFGFL